MPGEALHWLQQQGLDTPAMRRKHGLVAEGDAEAIAHGLAMTRLLLEVHQVLEEADIDHFFLKGPALSVQLYGDPTRRRCGDIDVMVGRSRLRPTVACLEAAGFAIERPLLLTPQLLRRVNAIAMTRGRERVEVHQHLFAPPQRWLERDLRLTPATVNILGTEVPTVDGPGYLSFLIRHGGKHYWRRLVWVQDVVDWMARYPGTVQGPYARTFDRAAAVLAGHAIAAWSDDRDWTVSHDTRWSRRRLFRYQLRQANAFGRLGMVLALFHPTMVDHERRPLPRRLQGLYWLLRPIRLGWDRLRVSLR